MITASNSASRSSSFWLSFDGKQFLNVSHGPIAISHDGKPFTIMIGRRARILIADARTQLMQNGFDFSPLHFTEHDLDQEPIPFGDQRAQRF